jgi:hypothetical protein
MGPEGPDWAMPPQFAAGISQGFRNYLKPLRMIDKYHFDSNRTRMPEIYFEVRLGGQDPSTHKFPDDNANFWVAHRQSLLASNLGNDMPAQPMAGEAVAPPGGNVPLVPIWGGEGKIKTIQMTPQHLIPRNQEVSRPSDLAQALARSYERYFISSPGAESAEVVRYNRTPIPPNVLNMGKPPPEMLETFAASFGKEEKKQP